MEQKRTIHYYKPGDLSRLERALNGMSRGGWQARKPGRFVQVYERGEGSFVHRLDYCPHRAGSGDEIRWRAARELAGWQPAARKKGWFLFRKPAAEAAEQEALPEGRACVKTLFQGRIARLESLRRWMLVLSSLLLIGGYVSDLLPVLYGTALPMAVALFVTYRIKFMEEGLEKDAGNGEQGTGNGEQTRP
ncbi:MAG: DUF2812 domain-containing protein [Oscillospiraceae bacterium]|nr:DUF2812 domain-containing protein [Oscillospiraceae bacterium]